MEAVFLAFVGDDHPLALDDIDFIALLKLALHHLQVTAALGAHLVRLIEAIFLDETAQCGLGRRPRASFLGLGVVDGW